MNKKKLSNLPLVSICLPVYNGAKFIDGAIASIRNTTYPNLEVIVSDDNSTDETLHLLSSANLPNVKILRHPRYGLVKNWNYCLSQAQGKYIKFLFQDDLLALDAIETMVNIAEESEKIGLVFSPRYLLQEEDLSHKDFPESLHTGWSQLKPRQKGLRLLEDPNLFKHPHNKIGEPTCTLIRRSVFKQVGLFDPSFCQYVDLEMWYRIMSNYDIAFINRPLASFRIHSHQQTQFNLAAAGTWLEIYQVWKKLLTDSSYDPIPLSTRKKLKHLFHKKIVQDIAKRIIKMQFYKAILIWQTVTQ